MRLTIGGYIIDGDPAQSTTPGATLRIDDRFNKLLLGGVDNQSLSWRGFEIYVDAANEAQLKTRVDAVKAAFDSVQGQTVTFFQTAGTPLQVIEPSAWPRVEIAHDTPVWSTSAIFAFEVRAFRDEPVSSGNGDEPGQIGPIEWELEITPGGLAGGTATGEFNTRANAAAWANSLHGANPPVPAWWPNNLRPAPAVFRALQQPNQPSITDASYTPVIVHTTWRQVYGNLALPDDVVELHAESSMVNEPPMDVRSGEAEAPAIISFSGYFFLRTEQPTGMIANFPVVPRAQIYERALEVYDTLENDFRDVHNRFTLRELGDPVIQISLDAGRVQFSRQFATTRVRAWRERTEIINVDPVAFTRDYLGGDTVERVEGGPVVTLSHDIYIEALDFPEAYTPPTLNRNWVRVEQRGDVTVSAAMRGGTIVHITKGASFWRYANPGPRRTSLVRGTVAGQTLPTIDSIGDGQL